MLLWHSRVVLRCSKPNIYGEYMSIELNATHIISYMLFNCELSASILVHLLVMMNCEVLDRFFFIF